MDPNVLTEQIIGAAIEVHKALGPGLLESVYEDCLTVELRLRRLPLDSQSRVPIRYKGHNIAGDLRIDLIVGQLVVVELKVVERIMPVHEAQLLTYLRLTGLQVGLLINFHVPVLRSGIKRMVNHFGDSGPLRLRG